jgi:hypothetical protein
VLLQTLASMVRCHPAFLDDADRLTACTTALNEALAACTAGAKRARLAFLQQIVMVRGCLSKHFVGGVANRDGLWLRCAVCCVLWYCCVHRVSRWVWLCTNPSSRDSWVTSSCVCARPVAALGMVAARCVLCVECCALLCAVLCCVLMPCLIALCCAAMRASISSYRWPPRLTRGVRAHSLPLPPTQRLSQASFAWCASPLCSCCAAATAWQSHAVVYGAMCVWCPQLLALVTTETPHMRAAAVMCLGRVVYEHTTVPIVNDMLPQLLSAVLMLFRDPTREVIKSAIVFLRVYVSMASLHAVTETLPQVR